MIVISGWCATCDGPLGSDGFSAGCKRVPLDNESLVDSL
jgi:hypothetical protein